MVVSMFTLAMLLGASAATAAPHILLMVLDDIGRADTGIYGSSNINLPTLRSLAKDGVIFENFYTQTVCSPTRSSLLTGLYPFRFGMQHITVSGLDDNRQMIQSLTRQIFKDPNSWNDCRSTT